MFDVIIIGGGIIGLATGYQILKDHPKKKLLILEKETDVGMHQTGHNSGVVHSGVRAQALISKGFLVDDFLIHNTNNMIHVINAPSPAATSSLSIGMHIKELYSPIIN